MPNGTLSRCSVSLTCGYVWVMSGLRWCTEKFVIPGVKNIADLITLLLELRRGRTGKWDVVKDAINSTDATVRLLAVILALAPALIATLVCLYLAVAR
jgi:hypothetical protein